MSKRMMKMMMLLATVLAAMTFAACGNDDDNDDGGSGSGSGVTGYYYKVVNGRSPSDQLEAIRTWYDINKEIDERWGETPTDFLDNGLFDWEFLRIDGNTICGYTAETYRLGASGARGKDLLYQFDGEEFGTLGYYGFPGSSYAYQRSGDRLIMDVGDGVHTNTFVITDGGLVLSGGGTYTKYNPNKVY